MTSPGFGSMPDDHSAQLMLARLNDSLASLSGDLRVMSVEVRDALQTCKGNERVIRGENGSDGVLTRLRVMEGDVKALQKASQAPAPLLYRPDEKEAASLKLRAEAWAIRIGASAGILTVLAEVYQRLTGG